MVDGDTIDVTIDLGFDLYKKERVRVAGVDTPEKRTRDLDEKELGIYAPGTISATQKTAGEAFSFSASYVQGDAVPTSAASVGAVPNFGSITSYAAGSAGDLAGTVSTGGAITLTAGGAGTNAVGQFVSEITVID